MTLTTVSAPTTKTTRNTQRNQITRRNITSQAVLSPLTGAVMLFGSALLTTQTAQAKMRDFGSILCRCLNSSVRHDDPASKFERMILLEIENIKFGEGKSYSSKEALISDFFNQNNPKLMCGRETRGSWREREHILKRSISANMYHFLEKVGSSREYSMDFNYYEIIDGEKETLLDYLDKILADEDLMEGYDRDELETLVHMIENDGGKRGRELE